MKARIGLIVATLIAVILAGCASSPAEPGAAAEEAVVELQPLRLEAEAFADMSGVDNCGTFICYVDGGDWILFQSVELVEEYTTVTVNFGKGNDGPNAVHVKLGSLDAEDLVVVDLFNTAGWNTFMDKVVDMPPTAGVHDIYFVFDGGEGVGNIDYIEFSAPE